MRGKVAFNRLVFLGIARLRGKLTSNRAELLRFGDFAGPTDSLEVFTASGARFGSWPYQFDPEHAQTPARGGGFGAQLAADINGDGKKEVIALSQNYFLQEPAIYVWSYDGRLAPGYPIELPDSHWDVTQSGIPPVLADIDGDGQFEIGYFKGQGNCLMNDGQFVYKKLDGTTLPGWPVSFRNQAGGNASLADLDGDSALETIFATGGGCSNHEYTIEAFRNDGTVVAGFPVFVNEPMRTQLAVADIDGDGLPEIMAVTGSGQVHAVSQTGQELEGFPLSEEGLGITPSPIAACPALGDVDGDGKTELVATTQGGDVLVWDMPGIVAKNRADWPMSMHDSRHSMELNIAPRSRAILRLLVRTPQLYCAEVTLKNSDTRTINAWEVDFDLRQSSMLFDFGATFTHAGSRYSAKPLRHDSQIEPGKQVNFGFCAKKAGRDWMPVITGTSVR